MCNYIECAYCVDLIYSINDIFLKVKLLGSSSYQGCAQLIKMYDHVECAYFFLFRLLNKCTFLKVMFFKK